MGLDNGMKIFTSREISSSSRPHLSSRLSQLSRETFLTALAALAALAGGDPQRAHSYSLYTVVYLISVQYYTKSYSISLQTLSHDIHHIYTCTTCTLVHLYFYYIYYIYICLYTCILMVLAFFTYTRTAYTHTAYTVLGLHYFFCINNKYCNLLYN